MEKKERNANNEKYMQGLGVTQGTVANVTKTEMLEELRHDVEAYTRAVEQAKKEYDNYKEQVDVDFAMWDLLSKPGMIRKVNPERFFEKEELYWELAEKKQAFKIREDRALAEGTFKQLKDRIAATEEALKNAQAKLKRFEEE